MLRSDALCSDFKRRLGLQLTIGNETEGFGNFLANYGSLVVSGIGSLFLNGDAIFVISNAARYGNVPGYIDDEQQLEVAVMRIATEGIALAQNEKLKAINARRYFRRDADDPLTSPAMGEVFTPLLQPASVDVEIGDGVPPGVDNSYTDLKSTVGVVSIGSYSLEEALSDVIDYHNRCRISAGLQQAADRLRDDRTAE